MVFLLLKTSYKGKMKKVIVSVILFCLFVAGCGNSEISQERQREKANYLQFVLFSDLKEVGGNTPSEGDSVSFSNDDILLDGSSIESAKADEQKDSEDQIIYCINLKFTEEGSIRFARVTGDHVGEQLAIILEGKLLSAPVIRSEISEGSCVISGGFKKQQAENYAAVLDR